MADLRQKSKFGEKLHKMQSKRKFTQNDHQPPKSMENENETNPNTDEALRVEMNKKAEDTNNIESWTLPHVFSSSEFDEAEIILPLIFPQWGLFYYENSPLLKIASKYINQKINLFPYNSSMINEITSLESAISNPETFVTSYDVDISFNYNKLIETEEFSVWYSKRLGLVQILSINKFVVLDAFNFVSESREVSIKKLPKVKHGLKIVVKGITLFNNIINMMTDEWIASNVYFMSQLSTCLQNMGDYYINDLMNVLVVSNFKGFEKIIVIATEHKSKPYNYALKMLQFFLYRSIEFLFGKETVVYPSLLQTFKDICLILDEVVQGPEICGKYFKSHLEGFNLVLLLAYYLAEREETHGKTGKFEIGTLYNDILCNTISLKSRNIRFILKNERVNVRKIYINIELIVFISVLCL